LLPARNGKLPDRFHPSLRQAKVLHLTFLHPFNDFEVDVVFTKDERQQWRVPAFCAGANEYASLRRIPFGKSPIESRASNLYMGPQTEGSGAGAVVGCTLRFDRKHQVLLITFGKVATQASALATYAAVERFVAAEGPCSVIADLSTIERVEVTGDFVRSMAWMPPVIRSGKQPVVVAPRADVYGLSRMFQLYRDAMSSAVQVVHTLEEAYALLALESPDFETVDPK
jgi:hypothetical protein